MVMLEVKLSQVIMSDCAYSRAVYYWTWISSHHVELDLEGISDHDWYLMRTVYPV